MARIFTEGFEDGTANSFLSVPTVNTDSARTGTYSVHGGIFGFTPLKEKL